jgi:hypothetical protein
VFIGTSKLGGVVWTITAVSAGLTMENPNGIVRRAKLTQVQAEAVDSTTDEMMLWTDPATKFVLVTSVAEQRLENLVGKANARDMIVLILNELKKCL